MGACLDQMAARGADVLLTEANAVSDNPLVFAPTRDEILSGGNFHAEPVAFAADNLALAIAEIGALSERRIALLMDTNLSGLPPFLVEDGGVNSGFMIAQVTAAALAVRRTRRSRIPHSVDSLPTSANQEDHVSMATDRGAAADADGGATRRRIVAIELLAAAQGVELRAAARDVAAACRKRWRIVRSAAAFWDRDRAFAPDLAAMRDRVEGGRRSLPFVPSFGRLPARRRNERSGSTLIVSVPTTAVSGVDDGRALRVRGGQQRADQASREMSTYAQAVARRGGASAACNAHRPTAEREAASARGRAPTNASTNAIGRMREDRLGRVVLHEPAGAQDRDPRRPS